MKKKICCFCQYSGNNRSYRNVGTTDHPHDEICELCDTKIQKEET